MSDEEFNYYICILAASIGKFPLWLEQREKERKANNSPQGGDNTGH